MFCRNTSKTVALMQPAFLPWLGYFELLANVDLFVFLDDFQFLRRGREQRNVILNASGSIQTISLPILYCSRASSFLEVVPDISDRWKHKILTTFQHAYGKTSFYNPTINIVQKWLECDWSNAAEMLIDFTFRVAEYLGIKTQIFRSSELTYDRTLTRSSKIASILRAVQAKTYLSANGSFLYMLEDGIFPLSDCPVYFQNYTAVPYKQHGRKDFVPNLSILDALCNESPERVLLALDGTEHWLTWKEMQIKST